VKNKNYSPIYAIFFTVLLTVDTSSLSNIATRVGVIKCIRLMYEIYNVKSENKFVCIYLYEWR